MNSHRSLLKVIPMIKPENWAAKDNGCVCFGEYVITNDDIKERLALLAPLQRPPQSTMEAMDILSGDSKYIAVLEATYSGVKIIEIEPSPVPPYAWREYDLNRWNPKVSAQLVEAVNMCEQRRAESAEAAEEMDVLILAGDGESYDIYTQNELAATKFRWSYAIPLGNGLRGRC